MHDATNCVYPGAETSLGACKYILHSVGKFLTTASKGGDESKEADIPLISEL